MANRWYYLKDLNVLGPFAWQQIRQMATAGLIRPEDMLRSDETPEWKAASSYDDLYPGKSPAAPKVPAAVPKAQPVKARAAQAVAVGVNSVATPAGVSPTGSIPAGKPVSAEGLPMGKVATPVAGAPPLSFDTKKRIDKAHPPADARRNTPVGQLRKKSNSQTGVIIGVVAGVAVIGVVLAALMLPGSKSETASSGKPADGNSGKSTKSERSEKSSPAAEPVQDEATRQASLIRSVSNWIPAGASGGVKVNNITTNVSRVWFSAEPAGGELEAIPATDPAEPVVPQGARYVFIEVHIANAESSPALRYSGWTEGAFLLDVDGKPFEPVPRQTSTFVQRASQVPLRSGAATNDYLAFDIGDPARRPHRLVLPWRNLGISQPKAFGFELTRLLVPKSQLAAGHKSAPETAATARSGAADAVAADMPAGKDKEKAPVDEVEAFNNDVIAKLKRDADKLERDERDFRKKMEDDKKMTPDPDKKMEGDANKDGKGEKESPPTMENEKK